MNAQKAKVFLDWLSWFNQDKRNRTPRGPMKIIIHGGPVLREKKPTNKK
jgi:hypothetical protein